MRRLLRVASCTLASAVLATIGVVSPAAAAPAGNNSVTAKGSVHIIDDEPWPAEDPEGRHTLGLKTLHLPTTELLEWAPCEDREVTAQVQVRALPYADRPGWVAVGVTLNLFEGKSCRSSDLADSEWIRFDLAPGETVEKKIKVHSTEFNSDDRATLTLTVTNWYIHYPDLPVRPVLP